VLSESWPSAITMASPVLSGWI